MGILTWFMENVWANNLMLIFTILEGIFTISYILEVVYEALY